MSDWLRALQTTPSVPPGLVEFAASQPSLAATWQNATRGDWLVWMAAHGFAGANSPRDIVDATMILADFAEAPAWRRALHFSASDEDALRRFNHGGSDFDLGQIVGHVYLGLFLGGIAGTAGYVVTAGHSLLYRELIAVAGVVAVTFVVAFLAQRIWVASVKHASASLAQGSVVALAERVAAAVAERSSAMQQVDGARIMRKRLAGPVASGSST
ncbi:MAG: hypothetical protein JWM53_2040 [bacterium]|nr:hypothetical protein [bacterium]